MLVDYSIVPTYVTYFDFFIAYVEILELGKPCAVKGTSLFEKYGAFTRLFGKYGTYVIAPSYVSNSQNGCD